MIRVLRTLAVVAVIALAASRPAPADIPAGSMGLPESDRWGQTGAPRPLRATPQPIATGRAANGAPADPIPSAGTLNYSQVFRAVGTATWYCLPGRSACSRGYPADGLYAAAGSELRVGDWRGRLVEVCSGERCIVVRLIDWCACRGARVIDLYAAAFQRLAPLERGVIPVTVRPVSLTLPATDTAP